VIGLFPDWFGDPQPDWPPQLRLTGFVLSDRRCAPSFDASAERSVEAAANGGAPIVFTPGSANRQAARFFAVGIAAAGAIGRRALLVTPYREQLPPSLPPHASHLSYAPFDTLFGHAAAVVHHGGIGTSAQAFGAGVPQLVMPLGFDQPDNGARVKRLGVGDVIRPRRFTTPIVADALKRLLEDQRVSAACRSWQGRMQAQDPLARTCDAIEELYSAPFTRSP